VGDCRGLLAVSDVSKVPKLLSWAESRVFISDMPEVHFLQEFLIRRNIAEWMGFLMMGTSEQGVGEV